jgi:hypothetical protein
MTPELLAERLGLAEGVEVLYCRHDPFLGVFDFLLAGPMLPECCEGETPRILVDPEATEIPSKP